jgi:hypothetical protein
MISSVWLRWDCYQIQSVYNMAGDNEYAHRNWDGMKAVLGRKSVIIQLSHERVNYRMLRFPIEYNVSPVQKDVIHNIQNP